MPQSSLELTFTIRCRSPQITNKASEQQNEATIWTLATEPAGKRDRIPVVMAAHRSKVDPDTSAQARQPAIRHSPRQPGCRING
jgi:hypothetical protein